MRRLRPRLGPDVCLASVCEDVPGSQQCGEAAYRGRSYITAGMLDVYVSERVKELTGGRQTPVSGSAK